MSSNEFSRLSPDEFERLVCDLLSAEEKRRFEIFSHGPDYGIDLRAMTGSGDWVVQCKNYAGSSFSDLLSAVNGEVAKVRRLNPARYILCTSFRLTPANKNALFDALEGWCKRKEDILGLEELRTLLRKHDPVYHKHSALWSERVSVLRRATRDDLRYYSSVEEVLDIEVGAVGDKFLPDQYVERGVDERAHDFLSSDQRLFLLVDEAGAGKTSLCCHVAKCVQGRPLAFVSCSKVESLFGELERQLQAQVSGGWRSKTESAVVVIDALNEASNLSVMRAQLLRLLDELSSTKVQVVISCRDVVWPFFDPGHGHPYRKILYQGKTHSLGLLRRDELDSAIEAYFRHFRVTCVVTGQARKALGHPLLLRFFCEAYADSKVARMNHINLAELFELYLDRKRSALCQSLQLADDTAIDQFLEGFASIMWRCDDTMRDAALSKLPHGALDPKLGSIYAALLEEGLLVRPTPGAAGRRPAFKYEAFQDYVTARLLDKESRESDPDMRPIDRCATKIKEEGDVGGHPTIETVAGFMLAIVRACSSPITCEEWLGVAELTLLHSRAVVRALEQVPASNLTTGELDCLVELATSEDPDTLRLARDAIADRYGFLMEEQRCIVATWLRTAHPGFVCRLISENFAEFPETGWEALNTLYERDKLNLSTDAMLDFARGRVHEQDSSTELTLLLNRLRTSSDPDIARRACGLLDLQQGSADTK